MCALSLFLSLSLTHTHTDSYYLCYREHVTGSHWRAAQTLCRRSITDTHTHKRIYTHIHPELYLFSFSLSLSSFTLPLFTYTHVQSSTQSPSMQAHLISLKSNRSPPPIPSLPLSTLSAPIAMGW